MNIQFSFYDILLLIGITQGLVTSFLLFTSQNNVKSSRFLALVLIAFCFLSAKSLLLTLGLWDLPYIRFFPNAAEVVIGPLLYLYLLFLLKPSTKWSYKHLLHFVPFFISQALAVIIYLRTLSTNVIEEKDRIANALNFNGLKQLDEYIAVVMVFIYLPLGFRMLMNYRKWLKDNISDSKVPDFKWLKNLFILCFILGLFLFTIHALDLAFHLNSKTDITWKSINLLIAFMIYYMGFVGYKQPDFFFSEEIIESKKHEVKIELHSKRENEVAALLKNALETEKLFLNPTINIQELSSHLSIPQRELSTVINKVFHKNFRDLINDFRVEEVKLNLELSKFENMSLLGLAFESGFNSEASFYRIFRKKTGMSPKEYAKSHSQNELRAL